MTAPAAVDATGTLLLRPLSIQADDDPDSVIVGRPELGEFVSLPALYGKAVELLGDGLPVGVVQRRIEDEHDVELDVVQLVEALVDLGFVARLNDVDLPDAADEAPPPHLPWLAERHVGWLFGRPMGVLCAVLVGAAVVTLFGRPDLVPVYHDFFWSDYIGLTTLVNTAMFSVVISLHELMHLAAARSLGTPARIGFGTRLHNLVVQTDVTAIWSVPRRSRYRVYLSGTYCDLFLLAILLLVLAYANPPEEVAALLRALALITMLSVPIQAHVYMRTDFYFVLADLLRCRNLFGDGLDYARYLLRRAVAVVRRTPPPADPSTELSARERRAVRIYAVLLVPAATIALGTFAIYTLPIIVSSLLQALVAVWGGLNGGSALQGVDGGLFLLVEGGIQVLFVVTFIRSHPHWFRRGRSSGA
ncbi:hypothetical protein OUY22_02830 [Nonomuraea sp. MCN248]|uniref:PqqD family protein n=1 Tax=Nonomuraea corallina TaxID=2989783 RepID=A0ABT4S5B8_9ACTN|nr:hypothetical protein [Nonomuraea corallina]MDA0632335.1 hypothetical protein [Nonomuraea corallina]